ncbi:uncharacterized protein LOC128459207 [Pleuronectes platessa]|uniref:uncharacterized protein LOC128459207 n=1 Tax=Pleuronectes platessa TaxID=8262 RepID=UPI00232A6332|nr:uncharacterized protein LOC128459207 [Pleuronectes platessa]
MNLLPPVISIHRFLEKLGEEVELRGGGVAAIFNSSLSINPKPKLSYKSFECLVLSLPRQSRNHQQPIIFAVVYRAPRAYTEFLKEFPEFLSNLVLKTDKIIIVGDFNIHVDNNKDCLSVAFISILDSIGFSQCVHKPTHCGNHTLDLVLSYGVGIENLTVLPRNPVLSDHNLITFDFSITEYMPLIKNSFSRCLPDSAVAKFKEIIPITFKPVLAVDINNKFFKTLSSIEIDHLVDSSADSLRLTLDSIAPLKKKNVKHSKLAPWYNSQTNELKQLSRKLERKWRSSNHVENLIDWKNSVKEYKKALHKARAAYYSKLIEENKNNPRFLFSTVARLTESHTSTEPSKIKMHLFVPNTCTVMQRHTHAGREI